MTDKLTEARALAAQMVLPARAEAEVFIEIREIYDGWSVKKLADGTLVNRWPVGDPRQVPTQEWIDRFGDKYKEHPP